MARPGHFFEARCVLPGVSKEWRQCWRRAILSCWPATAMWVVWSALHFHEELGLAHSVVSIDSLDLREFDYIDIGAMLELSGAVPVVIKSLLFSNADRGRSAVTEQILAATTVGLRKTELREYPWPEIPDDAGLLKIEAAGVCGSDWHAYNADRPARIMGHENVGRIYRIGPHCRPAVGSQRRRPRGAGRISAMRALRLLPLRRVPPVRGDGGQASRRSSLWNDAGFACAGFVGRLQPVSISSSELRISSPARSTSPRSLPPCVFRLGNGIQWAYLDAGRRTRQDNSDSGSGAAGSCLRHSGESRRRRPDHRQRTERGTLIAWKSPQTLGADFTIQADRENLHERSMAITGGRGVDISLDAAGGADTLVQAIRAAKKNGHVFFAAAPAAMHPDFHADDLLARRLTLRPVPGAQFSGRRTSAAVSSPPGASRFI